MGQEELESRNKWTKGGKMSYHAEIYKNVNVEWNKETNYLDIRDQNGEQLALLYVEEAD